MMATDQDGPRTFAWYTTHAFHEDGSVYDIDPNRNSLTAPTGCSQLENLQAAGLSDQVPTVDNLRDLVEDQVAWWRRVDESWNNYSAEEGRLRETLQWVLSTLLKDPTLDQSVLWLFHTVGAGRYTISLVRHPKCPAEVMDQYISTNGTKQDPTGNTKGGEVVVFMLHNHTLATEYIDRIVRVCRKATTQKRAMAHANVGRDALVYLANEGKTEAVKRIALREMQKRGMLKL